LTETIIRANQQCEQAIPRKFEVPIQSSLTREVPENAAGSSAKALSQRRNVYEYLFLDSEAARN
jgi:hypothetical protein